MAYWDSILNSTSEMWGHKVKGKLWGCGAGPSPEGYGVDSIGNAKVVSPHIMAGFLEGANSTLVATIKEQLAWMRKDEGCMYQKQLPDGDQISVPWRCSLVDQKWRADTADVIDFSTMVLGYASIFLEDSFYSHFVA